MLVWKQNHLLPILRGLQLRRHEQIDLVFQKRCLRIEAQADRLLGLVNT